MFSVNFPRWQNLLQMYALSNIILAMHPAIGNTPTFLNHDGMAKSPFQTMKWLKIHISGSCGPCYRVQLFYFCFLPYPNCILSAHFNTIEKIQMILHSNLFTDLKTLFRMHCHRYVFTPLPWQRVSEKWVKETTYKKSNVIFELGDPKNPIHIGIFTKSLIFKGENRQFLFFGTSTPTPPRGRPFPPSE